MLQVPFKVTYKRAVADIDKVRQTIQREVLHYSRELLTSVQCSNYDLERADGIAYMAEPVAAAPSTGALIDDIGNKLATIQRYTQIKEAFCADLTKLSRDELYIVIGRLQSVESAMLDSFSKLRS